MNISLASASGVPCAILFFGIIIWAMWYTCYTPMKFRPIIFSVIGVFPIWCMFSYPFDIPFVWLIILFIVLSIIPFKIGIIKFCYPIVIFVCLFTIYLLVKNGTRDIRRVHLQEYAVNGSKDEKTIFDEYETMYHDFSKDGLFLYNYAAMLHLHGYYEKSIKMFKECSSYINDYNMMLLMGDNYQQMNLPDSAISYYERASNMIPNRFLPLYYQMVVYQEQGEYDKAKEIAEKNTRKEIKIKKSRTIKEIIKQANDCLKNNEQADKNSFTRH